MALPVGLAELAAGAVEDLAGQAVAGLLQVELAADTAPIGGIVEPGEQVERLGNAPVLGQCPAEGGGAAAALGDPQAVAGPDRSCGQAGDESEDVFPVGGDQAGADPVAGEGVEWPVVGGPVDAPEPLVGQVGQAG